MNFVDLQKHIGTLATKYSDFEFNIRIYDLEGLSSDKYVDYDGKESKHIEFAEKRGVIRKFPPAEPFENCHPKL